MGRKESKQTKACADLLPPDKKSLIHAWLATLQIEYVELAKVHNLASSWDWYLMNWIAYL